MYTLMADPMQEHPIRQGIAAPMFTVDDMVVVAGVMVVNRMAA